jgi:hypothetical protein
MCGVCRARPSPFMMKSNVWNQIMHSPTQSIFIPAENTHRFDINRDYVQFLLAHSASQHK